jgi:hypothetical protein
MRLFLLALPLVAGCFQPIFKLDDALVCGEDFLNWTGGLTYHVIQGNGDGRFDYDPVGRAQRLSGAYDLETGDFSWETTYGDDDALVSEIVEGYGRVWKDGDLDIVSNVHQTFVDGSAWSYTVRDERWGCDVERRISDESGSIETERGWLQEGRYDYERRWYFFGRDLTATGSRNPDGTYSEELIYENGDTKYNYTETGDVEGYVYRDFVDRDVSRMDGFFERWATGAEHWDYKHRVDGISYYWEYDIDFYGNGTGTLTWKSETCDLKFKEGTCRKKNCTDGSKGSCW